VFPGGCDLATIRAVCVDDSLPDDDIEDLVRALIEKSLVTPVASGDELRVTQLQTLAQYGRERLAERGDAERVRDAMSRYFAALAARSALAYVGDEQRVWLRTVDAERDNLRAALEWAVDRDDVETAMTIAGGAAVPHWLAGTAVEGLRWVDAAFGCDGEPSPAVQALGLTGRGLLRFQNGIRQGVDDDLNAAIAHFRELGDVASLLMAYSFWAEVAAVRGDADEARRRRVEMLAFYDVLPEDDFVCGVRAFSKAKVAALEGDLIEAEVHYRTALTSFQRIDRPVMTAMTASMVSDFDERAGRYQAAAALLEEAIDLADAVGLRGFASTQLTRLAWALLQTGALERAAALYDRALDSARRMRNVHVEFLALTGLAELARRRGDLAGGAVHATRALELHDAAGPTRLTNRVLPATETDTAVAVCQAVLDEAERTVQIGR
jgi:tetratricopeptide (TPR) repeat protein